MTDNEIKKSLECYRGQVLFTFNGKKPEIYIHDIIDLINRQQAEIERLKDENLQSEYPARIRVDDFLVCANSLGEWLEFCDTLKAEAIKEFAEQSEKALFIKQDEHRKHWEEYLTQYRTTAAYSEHEQAVDNWLRGYGEAVQDILSVNDNLVTEMVGDADV